MRIEAQIEAETAVAAESLPVEVVYEDEALRIINKPAGVVVHPGAGNPGRTLQNALLGLDPRAGAGAARRISIHRLDKRYEWPDGRGPYRRNPHRALVEALAAREIERRYVAVTMPRRPDRGTHR